MASEKSVKEKAAQVLKDLEKTADTMLAELAEQYAKVKHKAGEMAENVSESVVDTTHQIQAKVASEERKEQLRNLLNQIEESGRAAREGFSLRMDDLSQRVANAIESLKTPTPPKKKSPKKKAAKKKAGKKKARKKAAMKKAASKKSTTKKAVKKASSKKKASKKKTAKKKVVRKKSARK